MRNSTALLTPAIAHHFSSGLYAKETHIPAGHVLVQHRHAYDHLSILASGEVAIEVGGETTVHTGPACLTIKAGAHHGVRAITDAVWFCIHATDCADQDLIDETLIVPAHDAEMQALAQRMAA
jgi:quercetin dioxygenase-like cupin family protein